MIPVSHRLDYILFEAFVKYALEGCGMNTMTESFVAEWNEAGSGSMVERKL